MTTPAPASGALAAERSPRLSHDFDLDAYLARSRAVDLSDIAWDDVAHHPVTPETMRTRRDMQDIAAGRARHPPRALGAARSALDESRHFFFYYRQAELRLARPGAARVARWLVDRFWAPVGSGVQARRELCFLAGYLFSGADGRAAARKVDDTIRRLPGFSTARLLEAWMDRFVEPRCGAEREWHGHRH